MSTETTAIMYHSSELHLPCCKAKITLEITQDQIKDKEEVEKRINEAIGRFAIEIQENALKQH
jgi:hypothetical protein